MELCTADTYLLGKFLYIEVGIGKVGVDIFHHAFHQGIVIALYLNLLNLRLLALCSAVFAADASHIIHQVVD